VVKIGLGWRLLRREFLGADKGKKGGENQAVAERTSREHKRFERKWYTSEDTHRVGSAEHSGADQMPSSE